MEGSFGVVGYVLGRLGGSEGEDGELIWVGCL